jgi:hypothetical protein
MRGGGCIEAPEAQHGATGGEGGAEGARVYTYIFNGMEYLY